jgi:hypothetical protein
MIIKFKIFEAKSSYYFTDKEEKTLIKNGFKIQGSEAIKKENDLKATIMKIHLGTIATYYQYHVTKFEGIVSKTYGDGSDPSLNKVIGEVQKVIDKQKIKYHSIPKRPLDFEYMKKDPWDTYFSFKNEK